MDKLILGRYIPGNSMIHRLDPRSKLPLCLQWSFYHKYAYLFLSMV